MTPTTLARRVTLVAEALEGAGVEVCSIEARTDDVLLGAGAVVVHVGTAERVAAIADRLALTEARVYGDVRCLVQDVYGIWADIPVKVYGPAAVAEVMAS